MEPSASRQRTLRRVLTAVCIAAAATLVTLTGMWAFRIGALRSRVLDDFAQLAHNDYFQVVSEPLRVRIGTDSRATAIASRLERAGYVRVEEKPRVGEFQVTRSMIAYREPAGTSSEKERQIALYLDGPVVRRIQTGGRHADTILLPREHLTSFRASLRERRTPIEFTDLPEPLVRAVLAAEDRRFFSHRGLDGRGIARALLRNMRAGRIVEGGSTITQQVVKQIMRRADRAVNAKIDEAFLALSIERKFSKQQILQVYLNEVYFGNEGSFQVHGVAEGAHHLFGRPLALLTLQEHVALAATIRAPNARSPRRNADQLGAYAAAITEALGSVQLPETASRPADRGLARAGVTRSAQRIDFRGSQIGYAFDQLQREWDATRKTLRPEPPAVLECSIDPVLQGQAADALRHGLESARRLVKKKHPQELQGAVVVLDAVTGGLRAAVGGRDYSTAPFNRALDIERPVGSTFKPIVYLAAFGGMDPTPRYTQSSWLPDEPREYRVGKKIWQPANFDDEYHGWVTARQALARSLNGATVALGMDVGVRKVARLAMDLGIAAAVPENPSILLGAVDTSPLRVAAAYAAIANGGFAVQPHALVSVTSAGEAHALVDAERRRVLDPRVCYVVTDMLVAALRSGTGASARAAHGFVHVATGKTGTTNDTRDAWFVGSTPEVVCAVWVGYDDNTPVGLTGAHGALPVWAELMRTWLGEGWDHDFEPPDGITFREIDPASGDLAQRRCEERQVAAYLDGTAPARTCSDHGARHWYAFGDSIDDAERERFGTRKGGGLWAKLKRALGG